MCYFVFYKTVDVFEAEEKLLSANLSVNIVPTPVQDKAYCGVCVKVEDDEKAIEVLSGMEYNRIS